MPKKQVGAVKQEEVQQELVKPKLEDVLLDQWYWRKSHILAAFRELKVQNVAKAAQEVQEVVDELHSLEAANVLNFNAYEPTWRHMCNFIEMVHAGKETRFLTSHLALIESMIDESISRLEEHLSRRS